MKFLAPSVLCLALAMLSGCESDLGDNVRSALSPREAPKTRVFQADAKATYRAALAAATEMGYRYVHGGPAEGKLEALSEISGGDTAGSSMQISMKVRIEPGDDSGSVVTVSLGEILEADSGGQPGMATEAPLKDTPLYEVFFRNLQKALTAPKADQ